MEDESMHYGDGTYPVSDSTSEARDDDPRHGSREEEDTTPTTIATRRDDSSSPLPAEPRVQTQVEHPSGNVVVPEERGMNEDAWDDAPDTKTGDDVPSRPPLPAPAPQRPVRNIDSESEYSDDVADDCDRATAEHYGQPMTLNVKELDIDLIRPSFKDKYDPSATGSKIVVIGKPGTGKTTLISDLLYRKRFIIPVGQVYSGTEDSNGFYQQLFPSLFVFNRYNEDAVKDFIRRQKTAKSEGVTVPWGLLLLDDCTDNPRILTSPLFQNIFKNGRHWKMLFILSLQYCMDIKPVIRTNVDGVFILRESNLRNRKSLYENYGSCIPTFSMFQMIMDDLTSDYSALYIHNRTTSNNIEDCVFYYKATQHGDFEFGSPDFRKYHNQHYNDVYKDPVVV